MTCSVSYVVVCGYGRAVIKVHLITSFHTSEVWSERDFTPFLSNWNTNQSPQNVN